MSKERETDDVQDIVDELRASGIEDGWAAAKILLNIRTIDREEIAEAIYAAQSAKRAKRLSIICCTIAVVAMLITGIVFAVLASGIEIEHTVTTETVEQDASDGGSNMYLGEGAQYTGGDG